MAAAAAGTVPPAPAERAAERLRLADLVATAFYESFERHCVLGGVTYRVLTDEEIVALGGQPADGVLVLQADGGEPIAVVPHADVWPLTIREPAAVPA